MKVAFNFFVRDAFGRDLWLITVDKIYSNLDEADFDVFVYADGVPEADYIKITNVLSTEQWLHFNRLVLEHFKNNFPSEYGDLEADKTFNQSDYAADKIFDYYNDREKEQRWMY